MAKVEIEEADLVAYRRIHGVADALLTNPETRQEFLALQKKINPKAVIPEIDARDAVLSAIDAKLNPIMEELRGFKASREKDDQDRAERGLRRQREEGVSYLKGEGYLADGVQKIEELMLAENISSYAAGLALFERRNPPSQPADHSGSLIPVQTGGADATGDDYKDLWDSQGRSEKWERDILTKIRSETGGRR